MPSPPSKLPRRLLLAAVIACAVGLTALAVLTGPGEPGPGPGPASPGAPRAGAESDPSGAASLARVDGPDGLAAEAGDGAARSALPAVGPEAEADGATAPDAAPARSARLRVVAEDGGPAPSAVELERAWDGDLRIEDRVEVEELEGGVMELRWVGGASVDVALGAAGFVGATVVGVGGDPERVLEVGLRRNASVTVTAEGFDEGESGLLVLHASLDADGKPLLREEWGLGGPRTLEVPPGPLSVVLIVRGRPPVARLGMEVAASEALELTLGADTGETFSGRVVEKSTRQPLAGVRVRPRPKVSGLSAAAARVAFEPCVTAEDGSFRFEGLPIGRLDLVLEPPFGPPVVREVHVVEGEAARTRDLAIGGAACVSGRIRAGAGVDLGRASVLIVAPSEVARLAPDLSGAETPASRSSLEGRGALAEVAPDGTFRCETAPAGRRVAVVAQAGDALGYVELDGQLAPGEERRGVTVELARPVRAAFRVVDDLGEPVEAVEARVRFALGAAATWSASEELVASDGRFECGAAATAVRRIRLAAEGHLPMETSWPVVGGVPAPEPVFTLVACTPLEVLVHDERGLAVRGARVEAWPASAGPEEARKARTLRAERVDRRGRGELQLDRRVGDWMVRARASGHAPGEAVRVGEDRDDELRLELEREAAPEPASVSGRLVRRGDGAPVPGLRFKGLRGGVALVDGAEYQLKGIRPGRVQLVATAEGYEGVRLPVDELRPGQDVELGELLTQATARVRVVVRDAAGHAVRRARVRLLRPSPGKGRRMDVPRRLSYPSLGDAEGGFERAGVPRCHWVLAVDHADFRSHREEVRVGSLSDRFEVVLRAK